METSSIKGICAYLTLAFCILALYLQVDPLVIIGSASIIFTTYFLSLIVIIFSTKDSIGKKILSVLFFGFFKTALIAATSIPYFLGLTLSDVLWSILCSVPTIVYIVADLIRKLPEYSSKTQIIFTSGHTFKNIQIPERQLDVPRIMAYIIPIILILIFSYVSFILSQSILIFVWIFVLFRFIYELAESKSPEVAKIIQIMMWIVFLGLLSLVFAVGGKGHNTLISSQAIAAAFSMVGLVATLIIELLAIAKRKNPRFDNI
jgi:hypothetical protein